MNVIKEVILNQLIRFPFIKKIAKIRHSTGRNNDSIEVQTIFEKLSKDVLFEGAKVLELGPGQTFGVLEKAVLAKASRVCAVDITAYTENIPQGIEFKLYDGTIIPFKNDSFDVLWSWSVFEHIRFPKITVPETFRILKKGGIAIHAIDLVDHFNYSWKKDELTFNCLKYDETTWNLMTWNRSNYVNRLRLGDWEKLFIEVGFEILLVETIENKTIENQYIDNKLKYLLKYSLKDASTMSVYFVLGK